jgi:hypothetical protein
MATQKQRRRRAKEKRHDYDLVYIDEDGVEQPVERPDEPRKPTGRGSKATVSKSSTSKQPSRRSRASKAAQPPSWSKVLKRGAIVAPIFLATVILLGGNKMSFTAALVQTVLLIGVFIPFSYFMDRVVWRQHQKRLAKGN